VLKSNLHAAAKMFVLKEANFIFDFSFLTLDTPSPRKSKQIFADAKIS